VRSRRYLELLQITATRSLKTRYRGSVLGIFWSLSHPILMTAIYALIFGTAFARYYDGSVLRYIFATFVGITVLDLFGMTTSQAVTSIVVNGPLLNKVRLPISMFPLATVASNFFQFFIGTFPLLCLVTLYETHNPINAVALVAPTIALLFAVVGFSLLTSSLYVYFRDLPYMYELVMFVIWITSPIFYPESLVPARIQPFLALNPIIFIAASMRQISLDKALPDLHLIGAALLSGTICLLLGTFTFVYLRRDFMDLL
jgi:ABC-type polysaccharide/polyol phosphate export permease